MLLSRKLPLSLLVVSLLASTTAFASGKPTVVKAGINPFSIVRINDKVNYMVSVSYSDGKTVQRWQAADCKTKKGKQLYWDSLNEKGLTTSRFYGKSYLRYAPVQDDPQLASDDLVNVCNLAKSSPEWEKISPTNAQGITDLIDVAGIHYIGKVLSVRLGYDFADIITEPPYDAPLGLKIEHYLYNCETHQGAAIALMNINPEGYVTDSLIAADLIRRKKEFPVNAKMSARFEQICQLPAGKSYKALGKFTSSHHKKSSPYLKPQMPDLSNNNSQWLAGYPLADDMAQKTQALIKPWALPRFRQISFSEVRNSSKISVRLDARPDGYIQKLEDYGIWQVQRLTVANLLQVKYGMSISNEPQLIKDLKTDLRFPLVAGQHFQATWTLSERNSPTAEKSSLKCNVSEGGEAATFSPVFKGSYLRVACLQTTPGQPDVSSKLGWLKEYNVMLPISDRLGDKPESLVTLEDVRLAR